RGRSPARRSTSASPDRSIQTNPFRVRGADTRPAVGAACPRRRRRAYTPRMPFKFAIAAGAVVLASAACSPQYDLVIKNGDVIDGTGAAARRADIAVNGDRIVA